MLLLVSPTKTMKLTDVKGTTTPLFIHQANNLMDQLKVLDCESIQQLFKVNAKIAQQVKTYFNNWTMQAGYQALSLFDGLQFKSMELSTWSEEDVVYASQHLAIMSGLYGILRASDAIHPYRLDFMDKINGNKIADIYYPIVADYLLQSEEMIVDICSKEYQIKKEGLNRIEVNFLENGKSKSTVAKQARGYFTRYFIQHRVQSIEDLKAFCEHGFAYDDKLSSDRLIIFNRKENIC